MDPCHFTVSRHRQAANSTVLRSSTPVVTYASFENVHTLTGFSCAFLDVSCEGIGSWNTVEDLHTSPEDITATTRIDAFFTA